MKPRRLRLTAAPLPTITETHEDASPTGCPACPSQSLDDYVNSIKALAQPSALPGCGPVRVARTQRLRLFSKPQGMHSGSASPPHSSSRAPRPRLTSFGPDDVALKLNSQRDCGTRDPVDWLFAQTQAHREDLYRTERVPPALRLL